VLSYTLDPTTGAVSTKLTWSAQAQLDLLLPAARKIYYANSGQPRSLSDFSYTNLTTDGLATNFDNFCNKIGAGGTSAPTQCAAFSAADVLAANAGANLVSYLRGSKFDTLYRTRDHVLGDIVNAAPLFVGKPAFKYSENGYGNFASASSRSDVVYVAANDGMLHALDRLSGNEKWAYIPSFVIPDLYKLADQNYPNNHAPRVDAAPVMGDIFTATGWKTILVGGLNGGGRGYYALDVTDSANPKLLWEFSDADLGLSFGNPVISKQNDGTWVVIFSSGYNNINPGDGNGHLYVLNANSGAQILKIATLVGSATVGSTATPSGLAKINAYIVSELDNTAQAVYGGDLLGNVWRFDINSTINPFLSALRLAELKVGTTVQPITTKPALAEVNSLGAKYKVVYIGTGKYLGTTDLANTGTQSIYALKDDWTATGLGDVRAGGNMVVQSATIAGGTLSVTSNPVAWASKSGWYLDLITPGERVNVNPLLVLNSLYVATSVPSTDACAAGGSSWLYKLDIASGKGAAEDVPNALVSGLTAFKVGANIDLLLTLSDGTIVEKKGDPIPTSGSLGRTSWRVLK
jgi:type IV pilus assembly protein PilY1